MGKEERMIEFATPLPLPCSLATYATLAASAIALAASAASTPLRWRTSSRIFCSFSLLTLLAFSARSLFLRRSASSARAFSRFFETACDLGGCDCDCECECECACECERECECLSSLVSCLSPLPNTHFLRFRSSRIFASATFLVLSSSSAVLDFIRDLRLSADSPLETTKKEPPLALASSFFALALALIAFWL